MPRDAATPRRAAASAARAGSLHGESLATHGGLLLLVVAGLFVFLTLPLATLLIRSFEDKAGAFVGLANFVQYVQSPALARSTRQHADVRRA